MKLSKPPLCSTVLIVLEANFRLTSFPKVELNSFFCWMFGCLIVLVLMFEWLTLWATVGPFPVSSQRGILVSFFLGFNNPLAYMVEKPLLAIKKLVN